MLADLRPGLRLDSATDCTESTSVNVQPPVFFDHPALSIDVLYSTFLAGFRLYAAFELDLSLSSLVWSTLTAFDTVGLQSALFN